MIDLYFGRTIPGRPPLTNAEWAGFARDQITTRFPDGFTVIDAHGQWLDPGTRRIGAEATVMVRIATAANAGTSARIGAIVQAYRVQFQQVAVGVTSAPVCAAF